MIKMIKGTYGLVVAGGVEAMTKRSAPFSLPEAREAELVEAGVAVKVEETTEKTKCKRGTILAIGAEGMKMAELRKAAAALGVDASTARTKKEVIAMIEAAEAAEETPEPEAETGEE